MYLKAAKHENFSPRGPGGNFFGKLFSQYTLPHPPGYCVRLVYDNEKQTNQESSVYTASSRSVQDNEVDFISARSDIRQFFFV